MVLKRIIRDFCSDCKHMWWLFKIMLKQFALGNTEEAIEAWFLIKIHWKYKSNKINQ